MHYTVNDHHIQQIEYIPTSKNHLTTWLKPSIENNKYIKFSVKLNVSQGWKLEQTS